MSDAHDLTGEFWLLAEFEPVSIALRATDFNWGPGTWFGNDDPYSRIEVEDIAAAVAAIVTEARRGPATVLTHADRRADAMFESWVLPDGRCGYAEYDPGVGARFWAHREGSLERAETRRLGRVTDLLRDGWEWAFDQPGESAGRTPQVHELEQFALRVITGELVVAALAPAEGHLRSTAASASLEAKSGDLASLGWAWTMAWASEACGVGQGRHDRIWAESLLRREAPDLMQAYHRLAAFEPAHLAIADAVTTVLDHRGTPLAADRVATHTDLLVHGMDQAGLAARVGQLREEQTPPRAWGASVTVLDLAAPLGLGRARGSFDAAWPTTAAPRPRAPGPSNGTGGPHRRSR